MPDVILSLVALRRGLRAGLVASLMAAIGAGIGGSLLFAWSAGDPAGARAAVSAVPAVSDAMIADAGRDMQREGWFLAALKGPLTSTPYKVYAMLAPSAGASPVAFAAAALPVRLPRFLFVTVCFALLGRLAATRLSSRWALGAFTAGWVLFYGWFWATHPG